MCCSDTKQGVCKTTVNSWQWHAWHTSLTALHADFCRDVVPLLCAGHLTNLSELLRRNGKGSNPASPTYSGDVNNASTLERKSSIERSLDLGATTASLVLNLYLEGQRDDEEVIMLSELQVWVSGGCCEQLFGPASIARHAGLVAMTASVWYLCRAVRKALALVETSTRNMTLGLWFHQQLN